MKKVLLSLGAMLALSVGANAYEDFSYKHSTIGSYMFGIYGGATYSDATEDFDFEGGLNTLYMYEFGPSDRINVGARAAIKYVTNTSAIYDSIKVEVEPFIGYKITPDTNIYVGYGIEAWEEVETDYLIVGADYFFSEDLMFEFKYKNKNMTQYDELDSKNVFQINAVIPFNYY